MKRSFAASVALALLSGLVGGMPAYANGYLFFQEAEGVVDSATPYLGKVIDEAGNPVEGVAIEIMVRNELGQVLFITQTDAQGRFRNQQVPEDISPTQVKVTADKPGYRVVRSVNLSPLPRVAGSPVEMNFVIAPTSG